MKIGNVGNICMANNQAGTKAVGPKDLGTAVTQIEKTMPTQIPYERRPADLEAYDKHGAPVVRERNYFIIDI